MPDLRKNLGDFGEQAAAAHLMKRGYALIARKWRCPAGEIDLLMRDGPTLVFVEVRTRRGDRLGTAEELVGRAKQTKLIALAYAYLEIVGAPDQIKLVAHVDSHHRRLPISTSTTFATETELISFARYALFFFTGMISCLDCADSVLTPPHNLRHPRFFLI